MAGTRNSLMGPPGGIKLTTYHTLSERFTTGLRPAPLVDGHYIIRFQNIDDSAVRENLNILWQ